MGKTILSYDIVGSCIRRDHTEKDGTKTRDPRGVGGDLGVIVVRVLEPVFRNLPHSYTWPLKKRAHSYTRSPEMLTHTYTAFDFLYPFIAGS